MTGDDSTTASEKPELKRKSVFIVSPIGTPGTEVHRNAAYALKFIFHRALPAEEGWDVHRADEGLSPDSIGHHVIRALWEADLVIADLTGHNPNVFYELAIAHGWRKPVVHLISKGESIPFDIGDLRTIFYDITDLESVEKSVQTLRNYAEHALKHSEDLVTPLTSFAAFDAIRADKEDGGEAVANVLEQVTSRLARIESRIGGGGGLRARNAATYGNPTGWAGATMDAGAAITEYRGLLRLKKSIEEQEPSEENAAKLQLIQGKMDSVLSKFSNIERGQIIATAEMTT